MKLVKKNVPITITSIATPGFIGFFVFILLCRLKVYKTWVNKKPTTWIRTEVLHTSFPVWPAKTIPYDGFFMSLPDFMTIS
jgi:hypothetical protein